MANVLGRLTTNNFDESKFGDDINLSEKANNFLNTSPMSLSVTAQTDLENGPLSRTDYFQNPVSSYISSLTSNTNSIIAVCVDNPNTYFTQEGSSDKANNLANTANSFAAELTEFLAHTNRISGISPAYSETDEINETGLFKPDYTTCMAVGSYLMMITANTDGVRDASPILGMFTSLYIEDELFANNWSVGNSTVFITTGDRTAMTPEQIEAVNTVIKQANTLISTRRVSDENYYYQAESIAADYELLNSFQTAGSTERNLINSKIGTTKLKNIING
jgi:hypothetical protein